MLHESSSFHCMENMLKATEASEPGIQWMNLTMLKAEWIIWILNQHKSEEKKNIFEHIFYLMKQKLSIIKLFLFIPRNKVLFRFFFLSLNTCASLASVFEIFNLLFANRKQKTKMFLYSRICTLFIMKCNKIHKRNLINIVMEMANKQILNFYFYSFLFL